MTGGMRFVFWFRFLVMHNKLEKAIIHESAKTRAVEYAPRAPLRLQKRWYERTDARPLHYAYCYTLLA